MILILLASLVLLGCGEPAPDTELWFPEQLQEIRSLSLDSLPALPDSPGNAVADDPRAVSLGHRLFFDTRLSANGSVGCVSCHQPELNFKDGRARALGLGQTDRKSMGIVGAAYSPWLFWDGRSDSLWAQALQPLEDPAEHGANRVDLARLLSEDPRYRQDYEALFGPLPMLSDRERFPPAGPRGNAAQRAAWDAMSAADQHAVSRVFANIGKALEAYQRRLQYGAAPFDRFAAALLAGDQAKANTILDADQRNGLRLFIGRANCIHCHNGPLFTNNEFHNTGLEGPTVLPSDRGRITGVKKLQADEFNCLGEFSDASQDQCAELRFVKTSGIELVGAFRSVSLRNIVGGAPFMHSGQFATLEQVLNHYNLARPTPISDELTPLRLTPGQIAEIIAFLDSLSAPLNTAPALLAAPASDS